MWTTREKYILTGHLFHVIQIREENIFLFASIAILSFLVTQQNCTILFMVHYTNQAYLGSPSDQLRSISQPQRPEDQRSHRKILAEWAEAQPINKDASRSYICPGCWSAGSRPRQDLDERTTGGQVLRSQHHDQRTTFPPFFLHPFSLFFHA